MKTRVFLLTLLLSLFCVNSSYAQLGKVLNKAKDKAKKAVTEVVKETVTEKVEIRENVIPENLTEQVQDKAATSLTDAVEQAGLEKKLKPSAAAIAADTLASVEDVEWLHTKSPSEIRATWEQLSEEVYYKPYYAKEYESFYIPRSGYSIPGNPNINLLNRTYYMACEANNCKPVESFDYFDYIPIKTVDGKEGYYVNGQQLVHAYFSRVLGDAKAYNLPINNVSNGIAIINMLEKAHVADFETVNGVNTKTAIKLKDGSKGHLIEDYDQWIAKMKKEGERLMEIVYQYHDLTAWKENLQAEVNVGKQEKFGLNRCLRADQLGQKLAYYRKHPQFVEDDDYKTYLAYYNEEKGKFSTYLAEVKEYYSPIDLPKTYPMNADITTKALAAAKKQFEGRFKVDKVVFLSNGWKINKENKYPYRTISRNMGVGLLTKRVDGVWLYRWRNLVQTCDWDGNWKDDFAFQENTRVRELKNYKP